ncbi:MAG: hypothetical protein ILNGONEN_00545 [Syntrophorhabdaceae bacterium]|nr:hypothetical protein [Syntrophorhabdaceae bacterium]
MVSLIRIIISFIQARLNRPEDIILVRRTPATKGLRAHLYGLTMGLAFVSLNLIFPLNTTDLLSRLCLWLGFALATYFSSILFTLTLILFALSLFLSFFTSWLGGGFLSQMLVNAHWYVLGYIFGGLLAIFYNDLVFLFVNIFETDKIKIAFAYDPNRRVNIIKSPYERQDISMLEVLKPIMFYIKEIEKNPGDRRKMRACADTIINFIQKAHGLLSETERRLLIQILAARYSDPDFPNQLEALRDDLDSAIPAALQMVEQEIEPLIERHLNLKRQKLYNYRLVTPPTQAYTIVLAANPQIRKRGHPENDPLGYEKDPLIDDLRLFLRSVDRALYSLERDEVVGRPEIWSRIRVVTVFNPEIVNENPEDFGLVQEFQETVTTNDGTQIDHNIVEPRPFMNDNFMRLFNRSWHADNPSGSLTRDEFPQLQRREIDVIFALTASSTHDRATARYSDWRALVNTETDPAIVNVLPREGVRYEFNINPDGNKEVDALGNAVSPPNNIFPSQFNDNLTPNPNGGFSKVHDYYATEPGRSAINVLSASFRSYVHEFAHAMSSFFHGTICDEYADFFQLPDRAPNPNPRPHFFINKIGRNEARMRSATPVPVPKLFASYNRTRYPADVEPPSAEENWLNYFPDRFDKGTACTMDRDYGRYRFDELLSMFIYDRLMAKVGRPL